MRNLSPSSGDQAKNKLRRCHLHILPPVLFCCKKNIPYVRSDAIVHSVDRDLRVILICFVFFFMLFFFSRLGQVMEVAGEVGGEGRRKLGKEGCT